MVYVHCRCYILDALHELTPRVGCPVSDTNAV